MDWCHGRGNHRVSMHGSPQSNCHNPKRPGRVPYPAKTGKQNLTGLSSGKKKFSKSFEKYKNGVKSVCEVGRKSRCEPQWSCHKDTFVDLEWSTGETKEAPREGVNISAVYVKIVPRSTALLTSLVPVGDELGVEQNLLKAVLSQRQTHRHLSRGIPSVV